MSSLPDFTDPTVRAAAVHAAHQRAVHPDVLASIKATTGTQRLSLTKLATGVAVVTGQQAGLFGGPLYTLHKAAAAIVNARALEAETGVPCAPVFWLQDEDHDFDEIARTYVLGRDDRVTVAEVVGFPEEAGRSVHARRFGPSLFTAFDAVDNALRGLPHAQELFDLLQATHSPTTIVSEGFKGLIERLFARHGLLVVDPALPELTAAAEPVHRFALQHATALAEALLGHRDGPIHVRPNAPLSFVHPEGRDGRRVRVQPEGDGYRVCASNERLGRQVVEQGPHSTSALLRPILQDTWLPTAAYVGGPGELAYLVQLPPLWRAYELPTPLIVPRASFVLLDELAARLQDQLGLPWRDADRPRHELLAALSSGGDADALQQALDVGPALEAFLPQAETLDPQLAKSVKKTAASMNHAATKLVERYRRALAQADDVLMARLDRYTARVAPHGGPQERLLGFLGFAARVGIDPLVDAILAAVVPYDGTRKELRL